METGTERFEAVQVSARETRRALAAYFRAATREDLALARWYDGHGDAPNAGRHRGYAFANAERAATLIEARS